MAIEKVSDIVLGGIMMPVTDKIGMPDRIKNDIRIINIPVDLITARAVISSKLSGIEKSSDLYVLILFDKIGLQTVLKNLSGLRPENQEKYVPNTHSRIPNQSNLRLEDHFKQEILCLMNSNLDDDNFGIAEICNALGMSRAQIYRKFRLFMHATPHDYLRTYKLQKAEHLLITTKFNVSEVAYQTGFKNISHFSRIFRKEFGKNPSQFRK